MNGSVSQSFKGDEQFTLKLNPAQVVHPTPVPFSVTYTSSTLIHEPKYQDLTTSQHMLVLPTRSLVKQAYKGAGSSSTKVVFKPSTSVSCTGLDESGHKHPKYVPGVLIFPAQQARTCVSGQAQYAAELMGRREVSAKMMELILCWSLGLKVFARALTRSGEEYLNFC